MTTFYVNDTGQATVVCPKCGFAKQIDTTSFKNTQKKLKAKCKCGEVFTFFLDFRKQYRKNVNLPGEYIAAESGERGEIIVENLSLDGIQFVTLRQHQMSTDDAVTVKFRLNNPSRTEIQRTVQIIWTNGYNVGAQYIGPKLSEGDLAFYLRS